MEYDGLSQMEVVEALNDSSEDARLEMLVQLGEMGMDAAVQLGLAKEVARKLRDLSPKVQAEACTTLGKFGEEGAQCADRIAGLFGATSEISVIIAACNALGMMGPHASGCVQALIELFKHQEDRVRAAAIMAVGSMKDGNLVDDISACLTDQAPVIVQAACCALAKIGDQAKSMEDKVVKILSATDPDSKTCALDFFCKVGGSKYTAEICKCLADDDALVRGAAVAYYTTLGGAASTEVVVKMLAGKDSRAKCAAALALGAMGDKAASHASAIAELLEDQFEDTNAKILAKACVINKLQAALRFCKCAAAEALPKLGAEGAKFADRVAKLLGDENAEVRQCAATSLGNMGSEGAKYEKEVMKLFSEQDLRVVSAAVAAVGQMGKATDGSSVEAVEVVAQMLSSQHPNLRTDACRALGNMGDNVFLHSEKLLKCFKDRCSQVRIAAIYALASLGARGQMYAGEIAKLMFDGWTLPSVRVAAIDALAMMGDRGAVFIEDIVDLMGDPEADIRAAAVRAMGCFGAESVPWMQFLEDMQADPIEYVRVAAEEAAMKIAVK